MWLFSFFFEQITERNDCGLSSIVDDATYKVLQWGEISCPILSLGESMGIRYVLKLLLVKSHKIAKNSATPEAIEKISADL